MKRLAYLALAGLTILAACDSGSGGGTTATVNGTISGTVSIEGTGVSGVNVTLSSGATTTTASGGAYSFSNVPAGAYTVSIDVSGHADAAFASTSKAATIATDGQVVPVDFSGSYIRSASILGSVSASGTGLAGVSVSATGPDGASSAVTDANGQYHFTGLRAGTYTVAISNVPAGYTFTTTSASVTLTVGGSQSAPFVGTKDNTTQETTASVLIKSVTAGGTFFPVNPAAVAGQIDITLQIDPGTNNLSQVCVLLNGNTVANGCQTLSSMVAAQTGAQKASNVLEPTFTILTNAFDGSTGAPTYMNGNYTLSARVDLVNATQANVSTSMQLTFANADAMVATMSPAASAVGTLAPNAGILFYGGTQTVNLTPVLFSGKTLASATVTFTGNATTKSSTTFPGSVTFTAAAGPPAGPLFGYQSAAVNVDKFWVTAALYSDGTTATPLIGAIATGPNGATANVDEVAPPVVAVNLTDQVAGALTGATCCSNNWVGPDYAFANGLAAAPADAAGGVGYGSTTFYVGAPASTNAAIIAAGSPVTTGASTGLALGNVNTENTVVAVFTDALGNAANTRLTGLGANPLTTFGYDNTAPTGYAIAAAPASDPDMAIYNIATAGPGAGLNLTATEDRAGFSAVPLQAYIMKKTAAATTYPMAQSATKGGVINVGFALAACGAGVVPTNAAPCYPSNNAEGDGLWMVDALAQDQAGNPTTAHVTQHILIDKTAPTTQNVALPPQVIAGSPVTYSAPVTDNLNLWSVAFGTDFGGDGVYIPFGNNVSVNSGTPWDGNFVTSATATLTLSKAIVARENTTAGNAPVGAFALATNVRAITTDAAGNQSAPFANNFIPGTVDPAGKAASYAAATATWTMTGPGAAINLCNGTGGTACVNKAAGWASIVDTVTATGASGTYANPYGVGGTIYVYVNIPTGGFYTATNVWYLLGSIDASTAGITDNGVTRTYTWTFTVDKSMLTNVPLGAVNLVAMGLNATTGTLLVSQPNANVTLVAGS